MTHQQISTGSKTAIELVNQSSLLRLVEIHHDIAAENYVVALRQKFGLQIVEVEMYQLLYRFFNRVAFTDFVEIPQALVVIDRRHLMFGVDTLLSGSQHRVTNIACGNFN